MSACLTPEAKWCSFDLICPAGMACDDVHGRCVLPAQLSACEGLQDNAPCSFLGAPEQFYCRDGVCLPASNCGNGTVDTDFGEGCDDGNQDNTDACPDGLGGTCQSATCGDGFVWSTDGGFEACDDGNAVDCDGCKSDCTRPDNICGDGVVECGEGCDDGNQDNTDACPDGPMGSCRLATCGDGFIWSSDGGLEVCDDGNQDTTDSCPSGPLGNCQWARCGDGYVWADQEGCDDGNQSNPDACPDGPGGSCQQASCGDGFVWIGQEHCDDGNSIGADGCSADCLSDETCGNGIVDSGLGEVCDDSNTTSGDGCHADCLSDETCGNGFLDTVTGESCDDGADNSNAADADCRLDCQPHHYGDDVVDMGSGEECDDENHEPFDGCSSSCLLVSEHLLISEICVSPNVGEFVEVYNPTANAVALDDVYLSDDWSYYLVTIGDSIWGISDFRVHFPIGATIAAGGFVVVSIGSASDFFTAYGFYPDYDMDPADANAPCMLEAVTGDIGLNPALSNAGEMVVLFNWDGSSDLVQDLDYVIWGNTSYAYDKTGVTIGASTYLADTAASSQDYLVAPGSGISLHRCDAGEGTETSIVGNGITGHDESSENLSTTFRVTSPSPGATPPVGLCAP